MIQGYLDRESVVEGGALSLHVSTDASLFRVDFYRLGAVVNFIDSSVWHTGVESPPPPHPDGTNAHASPAEDWNWPSYEFSLPAGWKSGIYVAVFVEGQVDGAQTRALWYDATKIAGFDREFFIVRPAYPGRYSSILYKKSTFTRHAYNRADSTGHERASSLYDNPVYVAADGEDQPYGHKVSMHRPGGINDLAYWDAPFIGWLERNGYDVEFCIDLDLHENPDLLCAYTLLLSVGHDEYWTRVMRAAVEEFVQRAGNVAFFSANTCWWRVHLTEHNTALVSDTDHQVGGTYPHLPATDLWWALEPDGVGEPENSLTGVSFRNGGMWPGPWPGDRPRTGFTVQHADHWVYEGTGLRDGSGGGTPDVLGEGVPLIGYECDGAAFTYGDDGIAYVSGIDGSPASFIILGIAILEPVNENFYTLRMGHWNCPQREAEIRSPRAATMGVYTANGMVFTAATTDWPVIVGQGSDKNVDRITRNVLNRFMVSVEDNAARPRIEPQ